MIFHYNNGCCWCVHLSHRGDTENHGNINRLLHLPVSMVTLMIKEIVTTEGLASSTVTSWNSITQYYTVLHSVTQYYTVLYSVTQCYTVLHSIIQYYTVLQCYTILHSVTQYYTVLHSIIQYYTVLHSVTQCYTVLYTWSISEGGARGQRLVIVNQHTRQFTLQTR